MIINQIIESIEVKNKLLSNNEYIDLISKVANLCTEVYKNNKKTILAGNGGSAADSQHIPGEL